MTNDVSLPLADKIAINSLKFHIYKAEEAVTLSYSAVLEFVMPK